MTFKEYVAEEKYKLLANVAIGTASFFIALVANGTLEEWKERRAFATSLVAVRAEAASNRTVLTVSYFPMYEAGLVLREFGHTGVSQSLGNPLFVKHASAVQLETLGEYLRAVSLANSYRAMAEKIRTSDDYFKDSASQSLKQWEPGLVQGWRTNLDACRTSIAAVEALQ